MSINWILLHTYVWARLFGTLPTTMNAAPPHALAAWLPASILLMLLLALLPFAAIFGGRRRGMSALMTGGLAWVGFTALALSSLLLVLSVAADVLFLRVFLDVRAVTLLVLGMASVLVAVGAWGAHRPRVRTVTVPIADLDPALDGFRIVQLSDLHVGGTLRRRFVERVVDTANGLAPDVHRTHGRHRRRVSVGGAAHRGATGPPAGHAREVLRHGQPRVLLGRGRLAR